MSHYRTENRFNLVKTKIFRYQSILIYRSEFITNIYIYSFIIQNFANIYCEPSY